MGGPGRLSKGAPQLTRLGNKGAWSQEVRVDLPQVQTNHLLPGSDQCAIFLFFKAGTLLVHLFMRFYHVLKPCAT